MSRLAMFGGTFDPFHMGHCLLAQSACKHLDLDRLLVVPSGQMPHRQAALPATVRLRLADKALADDPRMEVVDFEVHRSEQTSYTLHTLEWIRRQYEPETLFLVIGTDQFRQFGAWYKPDEILRIAKLAVAIRTGEHLPPPEENPWPYRPLPSVRADISGTMIRQRLRDDEPIRYLVPETIRADIHQAWQRHT